MKITEAIILAGGLGTRLRSVVPELPKCMAPVNGKPFIAYVTDYLMQQGINRFVFSLGYKNEIISSFIESTYPGLDVEFSVEREPLGTGGAIRYACLKTNAEHVIATNGDTLFKVNISDVAQAHFSNNAACTLSLKSMQHFDRYGVVELNDDSSVKSFKEKQAYTEGLINGGLYALDTKAFLSAYLPLKFSFEKDYLEAFYTQAKIVGVIQDEYFIDIGVPEDYQRAQFEL